MPSLGADMEAGTILEWLVGPGDRVERGDIVAVVHTEKADIEIEIFEAGVIGEILVPVGDEVPVGTPIATVLAPGEAVPTPSAPPPAAPPAAAPPAAAPPPAPAERLRVSPRARRLAAEHGIDLGTVTASKSGVVTGADIAPATAPRAEPGSETSGMRRAIAAAMARANREIPHYHLLHHVALSHTLAWLTTRNEGHAIKERVVPAAVFSRAVALAAREVPGLNGHWVDDRLRLSERVHLGIAISLRGGGLVAPAIHDADSLSLSDLMAALNDLTARARAGRLRSSEVSDATITVTNLGDGGVEVVHGIIYPPQIALVGFGSVLERMWAEGGTIACRPVVAVSLAGDHRASDGHLGARFLRAIERHLQSPEAL
jgi:pyruvate dehydrogenase E2 component (dihydrolipoamide acetyltransferase)